LTVRVKWNFEYYVNLSSRKCKDFLKRGKKGLSNEDGVSRVKVKFILEGLGEAEGELVRFLAPRTVDTIVRKLPIEGRAALWKEEVYFETSLKMGEEKAKPTVETGTIAFWPMGAHYAFSTANRNPTALLAYLEK
jgi:hypothetical protein